MFSWWIAGEVLMQAMSSHEWLQSSSTFVASLFNQRRYLIDDLVIGDYGGECSEIAEFEGAVCRCNQGGRTIYMKSFGEDYRAVHIKEGTLSFDSWICYTNDITLLPPLNGLTVLLTDSQLAMEAAKTMIASATAALRDDGDHASKHLFNIKTALSTTNGAHDKLLAFMRRIRVHAVAGTVTEAMLDVPNVNFIDP
ncbi:putative receptor-type adenylate cyclase, partial [Trypanosoma theileri]